jgi:hypothetical protein
VYSDDRIFWIHGYLKSCGKYHVAYGNIPDQIILSLFINSSKFYFLYQFVYNELTCVCEEKPDPSDYATMRRDARYNVQYANDFPAAESLALNIPIIYKNEKTWRKEKGEECQACFYMKFEERLALDAALEDFDLSDLDFVKDLNWLSM